MNAKRDHCLLQFHGLWTKWERSCTDPSESGVSTFSCVLASSTSNLGEFLFFSPFFFSFFTTCYYMRGLFPPPSHAQTCVKSNASLLTDLQESIGCPLTSHQNMIKKCRFLQVCSINIPIVTPSSPSAAEECVARKSGTSALMPTRNMIDWYSLSGDYSVHLVRLPLLLSKPII